MRRLLVTAALTALLASSAACASEREGAVGSPTSGAGVPTGTSGGATTGGAGAPDDSPGAVETARAGGNAAEVCEAATTASADSVRVFIEELGKSLQATAANDTAAAETAQRKAEEALRDWGRAMREQADRATDARLKAVLTEIGTEVANMKASVESVDEVKLDQLQRRLDQLCGR